MAKNSRRNSSPTSRATLLNAPAKNSDQLTMIEDSVNDTDEQSNNELNHASLPGVRAPMADRAKKPNGMGETNSNVPSESSEGKTADDSLLKDHSPNTTPLESSFIRVRDQRRPEGSMEDTSTSVRGAVAFMIVALIGVVFIVFSKIAHLDRIFVSIIPVFLMGAYAFGMLFFANLRLRDDQAGDNVYYLGFLYTLTSIGVSLYQFTGAASADEIVSNFGIAISSTIAGLSLRIAINQMRSDPAQVERIARHELSAASRRLRQELETITSELGLLSRTTQQKTRDILDVQIELVSAVKELIGKASTASADDPEQIAKKMLDQLDAIHQSVKNSRDNTTDVVRDAAKQIGGMISETLSSSIVGVAQIGNISSKVDGLEKNFGGILGGISDKLAYSSRVQEELLATVSGSKNLPNLNAIAEKLETANQIQGAVLQAIQSRRTGSIQTRKSEKVKGGFWSRLLRKNV